MKFLLLLILIGCSQGTIKKPVGEPASKIPQVESVELPAKTSWGTPVYTLSLPDTIHGFSPDFAQAIKLIKQYANSDEFMQFVKAKRTKFSHTDKTVVEALQIFRHQLNTKSDIRIRFYLQPLSKAIGGWNGQKNAILENSKFKFSAIRRAGHLLHETSHVFGWKHEGNYPDKNDNLNSFPYAIGYDFEEFLALKTGAAIAAE